MKRFCSALLICVILYPASKAHGQGDHLYTLPKNGDVRRMPWRDTVYRFPQFESGVVTYTGKFDHYAKVCMNYNMYYEHMFLINEKGDTLELADGPEARAIQMIRLGDVEFLHHKSLGYVEILSRGPVALGVKHIFILMARDIGPGSHPLSHSPADLRGAREDFARIYKKGEEYYFIDAKNMIHPAHLTAIRKLFPEHKKAINTFISERQIDFKQKNDLLMLVNFCNAQANVQ